MAVKCYESYNNKKVVKICKLTAVYSFFSQKLRGTNTAAYFVA
jgi:hypothetical protein